MKSIITLILILSLALSMAGCGGTVPSDEELSKLVADAILKTNADGYLDGECAGEGHKILGSSLSGGKLKVYALTMFGNYGFQNDMFVKVSGSGVIPAVLTFEAEGSGWKLLGIEYPEDGSGYTASIKKLFPQEYHAAVLTPGEELGSELREQERSYARAYLKSIGREAVIGDYSDLKPVLLTDLGVSTQVSNQLSCDSRLTDYPYWVGTSEYLRDGVRYVRSLSYDEAAGRIIYKTFAKDSGAVIESFVFDAATGKELTEAK